MENHTLVPIPKKVSFSIACYLTGVYYSGNLDSERSCIREAMEALAPNLSAREKEDLLQIKTQVLASLSRSPEKAEIIYSKRSRDCMNEMSIVRENLMTKSGYSPYCGSNIARGLSLGCDNPRTWFNGIQFVCPNCGWISGFPEEFIIRYKQRWGL